jgi:hypothetical protein
MDYLTQYYKNRSIQLQEQISILTRRLNESDANPAPQNDPGYGQPFQTPDGHWMSPFPQELPKPTPTVYNPSEKTYKDWLRNHPEPPSDTGYIEDDRAHDAWEKERDRAEQYYQDRQRDDTEREYYKPGVQGVIRAVDHWQKQVIPSELNPFW